MKRYEFEVQSIHPPEYKALFYSIFEKEKAKGNLYYHRRVKEFAPPPELIRDFVVVSAAVLTIIDILYNFLKEIKNKNARAKVYVRIDFEDFDLEAYNIDELKAKISQKRKRKR